MVITREVAHTLIDSYVNPRKYRGSANTPGVAASVTVAANPGAESVGFDVNAITVPLGYADAAPAFVPTSGTDFEADDHYGTIPAGESGLFRYSLLHSRLILLSS